MKNLEDKSNPQYWDNQGNKVPKRKVNFYYEIRVLCTLSDFRYFMNKHNRAQKFYDKDNNLISGG
jgi:hypothetical protein